MREKVEYCGWSGGSDANQDEDVAACSGDDGYQDTGVNPSGQQRQTQVTYKFLDGTADICAGAVGVHQDCRRSNQGTEPRNGLVVPGIGDLLQRTVPQRLRGKEGNGAGLACVR
jgi:hypothetical protein